jgi:COP9 signalosome complex subunit 5
MASSSSSSSSQIALKQFETANGIVEEDAIFTYDAEEQKREQNGRPWKDDIHYFKKV